jgi:aspartate racemase
LPSCKLLNVYGSSEVSADVTWHEIKQLDPRQKYEPIGKPMANTQLRILDSHLNPTPLGVIGELYIGGAHLARGYFNRDDLTRERFVDDASGVRLFRTGDLARWLGGGIVEHVGRNDQQVKVRGMRVELGEVENALLKHASTQQAAVISKVFGEGDTRLVAYIVPSDKMIVDTNVFRAHLKTVLPEFMIPSIFVILEKMPMTPSGKIDRRSLSQNELATPTESNDNAPRNMLEWQLCEIWKELLKVPYVGTSDNFFELGGHSLLAVRLFARIDKDYGVKLPVARLYAAPTVAQQAKMIDEKNGYLDWYSLVSLQMKGSKPPLFFVHGTGGCVGDFEVWSQYLGDDQPVFGLRAMGYGSQPPYERVEDMAAHYIEQMQSIVPDGPFYFGGYESGGLVAFEMARQLIEKSKPHAALLINTIAPDFNYREVHINKHFVSGFVRNLPNWASDYVHQSSQQRKIMNMRMDSLNGTLETSRNLSESFHRARSKVVEAVYRAFSKYDAKSYPGTITLFRTNRQPLICSFDPKMGWDRVARQVNVRAVPGSISSIIGRPEHAKAFAAKLQEWLEEVNSKTAITPS